jgi:copper oxidase (laccase) domain-containing protein
VGDKAFVDLRAAVRAQLVALGVDDGAVDDVAGCTRCEAERFFSYRREGDASGRLVGVVVAG